MSFSDFISHAGILQNLEEMGFTTPTPIQGKVIPKILKGFDIQASAQTGTGKTAAFLLPALMKMDLPTPAKGLGPRVLILVPTRELAMQVASEAKKFSKNLKKVRTVCIYGGAPYPPQNKDLSRPYEILVATPGRLIDHMERGRISFSRVELFILDEADRMLDMGFIEPVNQIADKLPQQRQTLLFSATLKGQVLNLSKKILKNPMEIRAEPDKARHENIEQKLLSVDDLEHKYQLLDHLLQDPSVQQAIIFTSTKFQADLLVDQLVEKGLPAAALHGDMNQRQRTRTIAQLRGGQVRFLVATDVAARGIDVSTISHVINFDLPFNVEDYVHRIGRTGRAGASGVAYSFASYRETSLVRQIEKFTGHQLTSCEIEGLEPKKKEQKSAKPKHKFRPKRHFKSKPRFHR